MKRGKDGWMDEGGNEQIEDGWIERWRDGQMDIRVPTKVMRPH